jgi:hypothetical protein
MFTVKFAVYVHPVRKFSRRERMKIIHSRHPYHSQRIPLPIILRAFHSQCRLPGLTSLHLNGESSRRTPYVIVPLNHYTYSYMVPISLLNVGLRFSRVSASRSHGRCRCQSRTPCQTRSRVPPREGPPSKHRDGRFVFLCPHCGEMMACVNPRNKLAHCFGCDENLNNIDLPLLRQGRVASASSL